MSAGFKLVQWNRHKVIYDLFLVVGILIYTQSFQLIGLGLFSDGPGLNSQIVAMRAWGTCAFAMLTAILMIGPLARLDRRFLPILYNRRHFGVIFFFVALWHAKQVLDFYHAYGITPKLSSLFTYDAAITQSSMPFQLFGLAALVIFFLMAATSHDFWQKLLGGALWKSLHMLVYLGYALVVAHVAFGALQNERHPAWVALVGVSVLMVSALHVVAGIRSTAADVPDPAVGVDGIPWLDAGPADSLVDGIAKSVIGPSGERIAVVRHASGVSALHGVCAHQSGPLGEGRVIDGCLTCPWHGWQYLPADGQSPPPFTEKLPTYRVRLDERGHVLVDPRPLEPGTPVPPIRSQEDGA